MVKLNTININMLNKYNLEVLVLVFYKYLFSRSSIAYSFTQIKCPEVSDYKRYGEFHIL